MILLEFLIWGLTECIIAAVFCRKRRARLRTDELGLASTFVFAAMLIAAIASALLFASRSDALIYAGLFFVVLLLSNAVIEGILIYQSGRLEDLDAAVACGGSDALAPTAVIGVWVGAIVYRQSDGHLGWTIFAVAAFTAVVAGVVYLSRRLEAHGKLPLDKSTIKPRVGSPIAGVRKAEQKSGKA